MTRIRYTIKDMQELAKGRNGECLSKTYHNVDTKLKWKCSKGHVWNAVPYTVLKKNSWCPQCAAIRRGKNKRLTIEEMKKIAVSNGGECISNYYINSGRKLKWKCNEGHIWKATPSKIKYGQWCPECGGTKKLTIKYMHELARRRGGECLSDKYINIDTKLRWRCSKGHEWDAIPYSIKIGKWCPRCAFDSLAVQRRKYSIADMQRVAEDKNGECLSKKFQNINSKLWWQCELGHEWEATYKNISKGKWCPMCARGVSERICRKYFEEIFQKKFPSLKPKWLRLNRKTRLELDGYCEELKIAFEYQGHQHFGDVKLFKNMNLQTRQKYDRLKRSLCKKNNIILIEIPFTINYGDMGEYILDQCKKKGIRINVDLSKLDHKLFKVFSPQKLSEMKTIAQSRSGDCLSSEYINNSTHLKWQCELGHEWEATPANIKKGTWCPVCAGKNRGASQRLTIQHAQSVAKSFGGKCLSEEYVNARTKLIWQCSEGHIFRSILSNVKKGFWCAECHNRGRLTIDKLKKIARDRGGECLSNKYIDNKTKLKWRCSNGHILFALPSQVKNKSWCPVCTGNLKHSLKDMQKRARKRRGKCLSNKYINARTGLKWQCSKGHVWLAKPYNIKNGNWCPICAVERNASKLRLGIDMMKQIAKERGGECLSKEYYNVDTKLKWRCKFGHVWKATPYSIKTGSWCSICARRK